MLGRKRSGRTTKIQTLIGGDTQLTGNIAFSGGLHIDGTVEGHIDASDENVMLVLSESGKIIGDIHASHLVLNGRVEGDVYATEHVELMEHAQIQGNVYYNLIQMAVGAEVNGKLVHQQGGQARLEHMPEEPEPVAAVEPESSVESDPESAQTTAK